MTDIQRLLSLSLGANQSKEIMAPQRKERKDKTGMCIRWILAALTFLFFVSPLIRKNHHNLPVKKRQGGVMVKHMVMNFPSFFLI
jgi:hypothetical protein